MFTFIYVFSILISSKCPPQPHHYAVAARNRLTRDAGCRPVLLAETSQGKWLSLWSSMSATAGHICYLTSCTTCGSSCLEGPRGNVALIGEAWRNCSYITLGRWPVHCRDNGYIVAAEMFPALVRSYELRRKRRW
jgi:hypothetical protein